MLDLSEGREPSFASWIDTKYIVKRNATLLTHLNDLCLLYVLVKVITIELHVAAKLTFLKSRRIPFWLAMFLVRTEEGAVVVWLIHRRIVIALAFFTHFYTFINMWFVVVL